MVVERFGHGADLQSASEQFGLPVTDWTDFSVNCNPYADELCIEAEIIRALPKIRIYPDPHYRTLRNQLAARFDVAANSFFVGNGAAEVLSLILSGLAATRVGLVVPSFSLYERVLTSCGARTTYYSLNAETDFDVSPTLIKKMACENDVVVLCHPNNPNGRMLSADVCETIVQRSKKGEALFIVDEAFIDFIPNGVSLLMEASRCAHLIVVRSLTKMWGIPGIRFGFAVSHPRVVEELNVRATDWRVHALSEAVVDWCYAQTTFVADSQLRIIEERKRVVHELQQRGVHVFRSDANFLLCRIPGIPARSVQERLAQDGLLIRNCSMYRGLSEEDWRMGIRLPRDNQRFVVAIEKLMEEWSL
ncbi:MAG: pyridoxal phosphate-dependent aminotransferase [Bacilli bacterium]